MTIVAVITRCLWPLTFPAQEMAWVSLMRRPPPPGEPCIISHYHYIIIIIKGGHSVSQTVIVGVRVGWAGTINTPLMCTPSGKTSEMNAFLIELFIWLISAPGTKIQLPYQVSGRFLAPILQRKWARRLCLRVASPARGKCYNNLWWEEGGNGRETTISK